MIMCTISSEVLITPDDLVFIASKHNRCGVAATFVWFSHLPQFLPLFTLSRFALSNLWTWYPLLSINSAKTQISPLGSKIRKWVISRGAEKKVNQFQAGNLDWFVSSTKLGFCSFTWPAGRINLPLMRVFVANWARLPLAQVAPGSWHPEPNTWNVSSTNRARTAANLQKLFWPVSHDVC